MLTLVREPFELVVDLEDGAGTKTGEVIRGLRPPLSFFGGIGGLIGLRVGGGLRASRSNEGRDEPMLPDGIAMSRRDG